MCRFLPAPSARRATEHTVVLVCSCVISIHALREEGDVKVSSRSSSSKNFYPRPPRGGRLAQQNFRPVGQRISIHALREEGDDTPDDIQRWNSNFYPRPPRGGRLTRSRGCAQRQQISIHALREEGDAGNGGSDSAQGNFYPRPPRGGRQRGAARRAGGWKFLSTPSARRATGCEDSFGLLRGISIHALREEGDPKSRRRKSRQVYFYPRPPRGGRLKADDPEQRSGVFLSTPSARRATRDATTIANGMQNFYPRPPRGGRRRRDAPCTAALYFYPRPPRGGRHDVRQLNAVDFEFLSTPSARRATPVRPPERRASRFLSTPSARRATCAACASICRRGNFYPRPPRGGRRCCVGAVQGILGFLSTPSARRATLQAGDDDRALGISIHALREEGDSKNRDKISIFKQIIQHSARI